MSDAEIGSTENLIAIKEIRNNIVFLKTGGMRKVIMATGVNMDLKSEDEQQSVVSSFQNLLNSLDFSVQFTVHSRKLAIQEYLNQMAIKKESETNELIKVQFEEYISFIQEFVSELYHSGIKEITVISMYPQASFSTTGSVQTDIDKLKSKFPDIDFLFMEEYFDNEHFIAFWTTQLIQKIKEKSYQKPYYLVDKLC